MKGDVKAGRSAIIGAAGEYFTMGELLRRGWLAGLTPRGARDFDIIATKEDRTIHVRVKTKTADSEIFRWNRREDGSVFRAPIGEDDFCVLVDLGPAAPEYYVIPTAAVEGLLQRSFADWLAGKPGRSAENRVIGFKVGRAQHDAWLVQFKGWEALSIRAKSMLTAP